MLLLILEAIDSNALNMLENHAIQDSIANQCFFL